jgi:tRNA pseudouridine38-40 synthase
MERNIQLVLEYDGSLFKGWQVQPCQRTVQGDLEARIERLFNQPTRVIASGRTDAGVHAQGQVVNFRTATDHSLKRIKNSLNGMLPPDISVRRIREVPLEFHARFDATRREYSYRIEYSKLAIGRQYAWWHRTILNTNAMQQAADSLLGTHDFTSFCVAAAEKENRECELISCLWLEEKNGLSLTIEANRFLRAMVRSIVGTLVEIGRGSRSADEMSGILAAKDRQFAGASAPPQGLFLKRVTYELPEG